MGLICKINLKSINQSFIFVVYIDNFKRNNLCGIWAKQNITIIKKQNKQKP